MTINPRFLEMARKRMRNSDLLVKRESKPKKRSQPASPAPQNPSLVQNPNFPNLPEEVFIFRYDGPYRDFFQELTAKVNERFKGTKAEIPTGTFDEVQEMRIANRMALVSTIANDFSLRSVGLYPITLAQSEHLLKAGKLPDPSRYWEDLALLLYDTSKNGANYREARALKKSIIQHRTDLGLSKNDLEKRLVVVNPGAEVDYEMEHGVKPIIIPGITQVYAPEILYETGKDHKFEYGLDRGLPAVSEIDKGGDRTLCMPCIDYSIGLRVLHRYWNSTLGAWFWNLAYSDWDGRITFARSASP